MILSVRGIQTCGPTGGIVDASRLAEEEAGAAQQQIQVQQKNHRCFRLPRMLSTLYGLGLGLVCTMVCAYRLLRCGCVCAGSLLCCGFDVGLVWVWCGFRVHSVRALFFRPGYRLGSIWVWCGLGVHMLSAIVWVWCGFSVGLVTVSRLGSFSRSGCPLGSIWVWCGFGVGLVCTCCLP